MTDACSDPHLLLGEYALRMNFITLDTLQDVLEVWTVEKQSSLGQTLVERGHISSSQLDVLEQQVRKYLQRRALEPDQDSTQLAVRTHPDSGRQSPGQRDSVRRTAVHGRLRQERKFITVGRQSICISKRSPCWINPWTRIRKG